MTYPRSLAESQKLHAAATIDALSLTLRLPARWTDASGLEAALRTAPGMHETADSDVVVVVPASCQLMIEAIVRLLCLLNQLDHCTKRVIVQFEQGESPVFGYLDRVGFFDHLSPSVEVQPYRPAISGADRFRGRNPGVVEIARIDRANRDGALLTRLTSAVTHACSGRADVAELEGATWTVLAELIDNVFSHSQTPLDGFAALQEYRGGNCLKVVVSDSGLGIMQTLRPALRTENPRLARMSDSDLLVEVFRQGLSRHGADRGLGLKGCAGKAIKFRASLDVRLPTVRVFLEPGRSGYAPNTAHCYDKLPLLWGTHIAFTFQLD